MGDSPVLGDYFVIKALEHGVQVIGLTRGTETKFHHAEKLDKGEAMVAQFTEHTSAMKIRGHAILYTKFGTIPVGDEIRDLTK
ncbi:trp RNA-binding attenuation protein MtrB [Alicyclobacillaceae bacterium I2511]|nr:trp RNA-binding attenuation protein MtrB [Alicyclobacillaceae bacterium I2511]